MSEIDFIEIKKKFNSLNTKMKTELKRAKSPDDLENLMSFYIILPEKIKNSSLHKFKKQWQRIIFLLPFLEHENYKENKESLSIGNKLALKGIKEQRIHQLCVAEYPNNFIMFKRIIKHANIQNIDWQSFGELIYFWGDKSKNKLKQDYYVQCSYML